MEKLFELHAEDRYDLLVLDTPPTRNALDFLEAPKRLMQFIEGRALQVFMRPTGLGMRVFGRGTSMMFSVLRRITGVELLEDLSEFFQAFSGMVGGFRERAQAGQRAARRAARPASSSSAGRRGSRSPRPSTSTASWSRRSCRSAGVIVNKVHYESELPDHDPEQLRERARRRRSATRTSPIGSSAELRRLPRRSPRATGRNIERLTAEMRRPARDPGPVPGHTTSTTSPGLMRDQPLPVRGRRAASAPRSRPRSEPGADDRAARPGDSSLLFLGDRRRKLLTSDGGGFAA